MTPTLAASYYGHHTLVLVLYLGTVTIGTVTVTNWICLTGRHRHLWALILVDRTFVSTKVTCLIGFVQWIDKQ